MTTLQQVRLQIKTWLAEGKSLGFISSQLHITKPTAKRLSIRGYVPGHDVQNQLGITPHYHCSKCKPIRKVKPKICEDGWEREYLKTIRPNSRQRRKTT